MLQEKGYAQHHWIARRKAFPEPLLPAILAAMVARIEYPDPAAAPAPETIARNRRLVDREFWRKLSKFAGKIPFAEELAAAWFCVADPGTPVAAKGILVAALAYFVTPVDVIPDFIAGLGFTDDATVLALAIGAVSRHLKPEHYARARTALGRAEDDRSPAPNASLKT